MKIMTKAKYCEGNDTGAGFRFYRIKYFDVFHIILLTSGIITKRNENIMCSFIIKVILNQIFDIISITITTGIRLNYKHNIIL